MDAPERSRPSCTAAHQQIIAAPEGRVAERSTVAHKESELHTRRFVHWPKKAGGALECSRYLLFLTPRRAKKGNGGVVAGWYGGRVVTAARARDPVLRDGSYTSAEQTADAACDRVRASVDTSVVSARPCDEGTWSTYFSNVLVGTS